MIDEQLPKFDIPGDFIPGDFITKEILDFYKTFPCKIKSGVFVILTQGEIDATINLSQYTVKADDFVVVAPNSFIQIHDVRGIVRLHFVAFSSGFLKSVNFHATSLDLLPLLIGNPVMHLPSETAVICRDFIDVIMRAYISDDKLLDKESYRSILNFFMQQLTKFYRNNPHLTEKNIARDKAILKDFMSLLLKHYTTEHSVTYYAKALGITLQHFCNTIKKVTGTTALDIISGMIIMDAKAQLKASNMAIKEIAISLGFNNQAFFNKFFKQHTGMTPQEYRKN